MSWPRNECNSQPKVLLRLYIKFCNASYFNNICVPIIFERWWYPLQQRKCQYKVDGGGMAEKDISVWKFIHSMDHIMDRPRKLCINQKHKHWWLTISIQNHLWSNRISILRIHENGQALVIKKLLAAWGNELAIWRWEPISRYRERERVQMKDTN